MISRPHGIIPLNLLQPNKRPFSRKNSHDVSERMERARPSSTALCKIKVQDYVMSPCFMTNGHATSHQLMPAVRHSCWMHCESSAVSCCNGIYHRKVCLAYFSVYFVVILTYLSSLSSLCSFFSFLSDTANHSPSCVVVFVSFFWRFCCLVALQESKANKPCLPAEKECFGGLLFGLF